MAEFDWWLLVVGLVVGGGLVYLVLLESRRREADVETEELEAEATFVSERLADGGLKISREDVADVLREHRAYLGLPPPDAIVGADAAVDPMTTPGSARAGMNDPRAVTPPEPAPRATRRLTDGETGA